MFTVTNKNNSHLQEHDSHIQKDTPITRDLGILFSFHNTGIITLHRYK